MGSNPFLASSLLVTILVASAVAVTSDADKDNGRCPPETLQKMLSFCTEYYNATGLNNEEIDRPWEAVKEADNMCTVLTKSAYLNYVQCRNNAFSHCQPKAYHYAQDHDSWYDVVCDLRHDRKCLQELFGTDGGGHQCEQKDFSKEVEAIANKYPWLYKRCQLRHETNKCIAEAMEVCSKPTATLFRWNIQHALDESCIEHTIVNSPVG